MRLRATRCLTVLLAMLMPALGVLPTAAFSEASPRLPVQRPSEEDPAGARVIVKYKALGSLMRALHANTGGDVTAAPVPGRGPQLAARMSQRAGLALADGRIIDGRSQVVRGDKSLSSAALAARLAADPEVEYAVPDLRRRALAVPNDPLYAAAAAISPAVGQWYLRAPDATVVSAINAAAAWDVTTGSASIVVADLDTGVRFDHPDLANKLFPGYDFIADLATAGDGDGRDSDASDPGDWTTAGQCSSGSTAENSSWHGTQTSGLLAAQTNNGVGMAGVGYNVMVLPVRVLGHCGGYDSDIVAGMLWAGGVSANPVANAHPARVINLSLGGTGSCNAAYTDAVSRLTAAGVVIVAAAGNAEGLTVGIPANCAGVIAVAGVRHVGTKVGFSSIGPEVAIAAPAGNCVNTSGACLYPILTTTNTGTTTPLANTYSNSSNYSVGTSFATPLVAGTAALMLSSNPALTPAQVTTLIKNSARPFPTTSTDPTVQQCHAPTSAVQDECICTTSTCGAGLLDAGAAVRAAAALRTTPAAVVATSTGMPLVGSTVALNGAASLGTPVSFLWTIRSGASQAALVGTPSASQISVNVTGGGAVGINLMVTDNTGASANALVTLQAVQVPQALISSPASTTTVGNTLTFDGSLSTADSTVGRSVASYQWSIVSGASAATINGSGTGPTVTVTSLAAGTFTLQLLVTDSRGAQATQTATVTVSAAAASSGGSTSGPGGGGALGWPWLALLAAAVVALFRAGPHKA